MQAKRFFGIPLNFSSPIEVYRSGWLFLAGTSALYLFFIIIRSGLGLSFELTPQQLNNQAANIHRSHSNLTISKNEARGRNTSYATNQNVQHREALIQRSRTFKRQEQQPTYNRQEVPQSAAMHKANLLISPGSRTSVQQTTEHVGNNRNVKRRSPNANIRQHIDRNTNNQQRIRTVQIRRESPQTPVVQGNFISNAGYAQGFVQDLQFHTDNSPNIQPAKKKKMAKALYGINLAKARSVSEIRQHWARLNSRYFKLLRTLDPLIYKDNSGDQFPIKLIVGPFHTPESAIKFCARLQTTYDCNLKRYSGTPL